MVSRLLVVALERGVTLGRFVVDGRTYCGRELCVR